MVSKEKTPVVDPRSSTVRNAGLCGLVLNRRGIEVGLIEEQSFYAAGQRLFPNDTCYTKHIQVDPTLLALVRPLSQRELIFTWRCTPSMATNYSNVVYIFRPPLVPSVCSSGGRSWSTES
jgi:hypothetical protein